jgi:AcrR family transcriptional regulator
LISNDQLFTEVTALYYEKGGRFTMDELAARLRISKKTLYEMAHSKEELALQMVEYYCAGVDALQDAIHADVSLSPLEKLKELLCATPDLPMRKYHLQELRLSFPAAYQKLDDWLRLGWQRTLEVLDQAKVDGSVRPIDNLLFSTVYAAAIEDTLMQNDVRSDLTFRQKQEQIVDLLLYGICK